MRRLRGEARRLVEIEMTASEPLTLEEEFDMQQSWAVDPDSEFSIQ